MAQNGADQIVATASKDRTLRLWKVNDVPVLLIAHCLIRDLPLISIVWLKSLMQMSLRIRQRGLEPLRFYMDIMLPSKVLQQILLEIWSCISSLN